MWQSHYRFLVEDIGKHQAFLPTDHPFYVLLESEGSDQEREQEQFMAVLATLMEEGHVADAVIAQSSQQAAQLWEMRDDVEAIIQQLFPLAGFDISLPIREMEAYISALTAALTAQFPGARILTFGHLGDGNLHLAIGPSDDLHGVETLVYDMLGEIGGSISAEHGIGLLKKEFLSRSRAPAEIALMKTLKAALDPKGILNPGKLLQA
jgi:FAD/FMN-containing dehydrogenase